MSGKVAKRLRRMSDNRRQYRSLKHIYTHQFKFDTSSKELPF